MLARERQNIILEMLEKNNGTIKMTEITAAFNVSNETARRDLETLQDKNLVKRIYGGAILVDRSISSFRGGHVQSDDQGHAEREAIGKAAAALVQEGETVILSSGTTVMQVAHALKQRLRNLTVLTNSLMTLNEVSDSSFDVYVLGGKLDLNERNICGDAAVQTVRSVFADTLILGCGGVTVQYGVSDYSLNDQLLREEMVNHAARVILVAQSDKFGRNAFSLNIPLEKIHTVVTDTNLPVESQNILQSMGIRLILADPAQF